MKKLFVKLIWFSIPFTMYFIIVSIVDPFSYFDFNNIVKHKTKEQISIAVEPHLYKMIAFENNPKKNILIGDSRSNRFYETISEHSDEWSSLDYGGASLNEILSTFEWISKNNYNIDTLIVGINFNLYNKYNKRMWVEETIERKSNFFSYAFSSYTAKALFLILQKITIGNKNAIGEPKLTRAKFWDTIVKQYGERFYNNYGYPDDSYKRLFSMANYCKKNNVELIFWIPPCSNDINNIIDEYGLTSENKRFINDIRVLGKLYDFNNNKSITSVRNNFTDPSQINR